MEPTSKGTGLLAVPVRPHKFSVIDHITKLTEAAYATQLRKLTEDVTAILRNARGVTEKSLVVYLNPAGRPVRGETLMKAVKAPPKGDVHHAGYDYNTKTGKHVHVDPKGRQKVEEAPKGKKGKKQEAGPGWYRDAQGNLQYLTDPTFRYGQKLTDEEVSKMHHRVFALLSNPQARDEVHEALVNAEVGLDDEDVNNFIAVGEHLARYGGSADDVFMELADAAGCTPADAQRAWRNANEACAAALELPAVQQALKRLDKDQAAFAKDVAAFAKDFEGLDGHAQSWLHGEPADTALKMVGVALNTTFMYMAEGRNDVPSEHRKNWRNYVGQLVVNTDMLDQLAPYMSTLTPEFTLACAFMAHFAGDEELSKAFMAGAKEQLGRGLGEDEKADLDSKINLHFKNAADLIKSWNNSTGGKSIDQLLAAHKKGTLQDMLIAVDAEEADAQIEALKAADEDHAKLVKACLDAQESEDLPKGGFSKSLVFGQVDPATGKKMDLLPHQKKFLNWMLTAKRGINAATMGMGKTPMTIATIDHLLHTGKAKHGVVVMPPTLLAQWPSEIERFRPGSVVKVLDDTMSAQDRLLLIQAINDGTEKCDFLLMSSGVARAYDRSKIKLEGVDFDAETGEISRGGKDVEEELDVGKGQKVKTKSKKLSPEQQEELKKQLRNDPWLKALKQMKAATFYDEAHSESQGLKNPNNVSNMCCSFVNEGREYHHFLTGTPIPNTPIDLYHLMNTVHPGSAGESAGKFMGRVAVWDYVPDLKTGKMKPVIVNYENIAEMREMIGPFCFIKGRNDPDVASHIKLPGLTSKSHLLTLYPEQQKEYQRAMSEWIDTTTGERKEDPTGKGFNALVKINQTRMAAIHPRLIDPNYKGRGAKIDHTVRLIKEKFADPANADRPMVVFCSYSGAFDILKEELVKAGMHESQLGIIASGVDGKERGVTQDAANLGKKRVIMVGIKAGGAGLNLQGLDIDDPKHPGKKIHVGPDCMTFLDNPWAPGALDQAIGRSYRIGQKNPVTVHKMRVAGTYDDDLLEKLQDKVKAVRGVMEANKGADHVEVAAQGDVSQMLADWAAHPEKYSLDSLPEEQRLAAKEAMIHLLGANPAHGADEAFAQKLGFSLSDPDAKAKRKAAASLKMGDFVKQHFDVHEFVEQRDTQSYFKMGKQKLLNARAVANIKLRKKMMSRAEHTALMQRIDKGIKRWEAAEPVWSAAMARGEKLTRKEIDAKLKEDAGDEGPDTGLAAPTGDVSISAAKKAKAKLAEKKAGKPKVVGKVKLKDDGKGNIVRPGYHPPGEKEQTFKVKLKKSPYKDGSEMDNIHAEALRAGSSLAKWIKHCKKAGFDEAQAKKWHARLVKDGVLG